MFYCRIHLLQHGGHSKHRKRKQHFSEDIHERASSSSAAQLASLDVDLSTSLVACDDSQKSPVIVEKKKFKSCGHNDDHGIEDKISSNKSLRHSEKKRARHCKKSADERQLDSAQHLETFTADHDGLDDDQCVVTADQSESQPTSMMPEPNEHLMLTHSIQPQTAKHANESVDDSNVTATLTITADRHMNDNSFVSDNQQLKLTHSAKRRRRRHRTRKNAEKDEADEPNNEQCKNISAPIGGLVQNVAGNNKLPTPASHSLVSGFGRTHIIFDNANSGDENSVKAEQPTSRHACNKYDSETSKCDVVSGNDAVVPEAIVNNSSHIEANMQLQNKTTDINGLVDCDVKKASVSRLPSKTRVHPQARNSPFANVQVFCRQRLKKSYSATSLQPDQVSGTTTTLLPKQARIYNSFMTFIAY